MASGKGSRMFKVVTLSGEEIVLRADRYTATKDPAMHAFHERNELVAAFGVDQVLGAYEIVEGDE